ncbi:MAG: hypothetical protein LBJ62_06790 [Bifidobacteriaceae bacterium]|jgi:hypothetical protein|nr:hypothetical protein [Bifidobacteriaceae bacterium]
MRLFSAIRRNHQILDDDQAPGRSPASLADSEDKRFYAFVSYGMTFGVLMRLGAPGTAKALEDLRQAMPALVARACGTTDDQVVIVDPSDWLLSGREQVNTMHFDCSPADPVGEEQVVRAYLDLHGLRHHMIGDVHLLALREGLDRRLTTLPEERTAGRTINATMLDFSAVIAMHRDIFTAATAAATGAADSPGDTAAKPADSPGDTTAKPAD